MLNKSEFATLADKVVYTAFDGQQDQKIIYKIERDSLIDELYDPPTNKTNNTTTVMKFGEGAEEAIKVIGLVISLYKILKDLYSFVEKNKSSTVQLDQGNLDMETIKNNWKTKMVEEKIDPATATTIADTFGEDIKSYFKK